MARELGEWRGTGPAYRCLAERIRVLLMDGRLASGSRLPAERELSQALDLSRTTVAAAYAKLRSDGFLESVRGSGSSLQLPGRDRGLHRVHNGLALDFTKSTAPAYPGLSAAYAAAVDKLPAHLGHDGFDMLGLPELREAIAQNFSDRGLPTSPDQIMVTIGAQHALHLVTRTVFSAGDRVLVEQPTYPHALDTFTSVGARVVAFPVHHEGGWALQEALRQLRSASPALAYVMPDFHNPTGLSMGVHEREVLAAAADRAGTLVVVDETTALLDIDRGPLPPMASFSENILTLGSLGKLAWGGLRIGWIRGPRSVVAKLVRARAAVDLGTPILEQLVAKELLDDLPQLVANRRLGLAAGRDAAVSLLNKYLPEWPVHSPSGGLNLWINTGDISSSALALAAQAQGLGLVPGPRFGIDGAFERFLRLPFAYDEAALDEAIRIVARLASTVGAIPLQMPRQSVI